jgi:hypothetical protein
MRELIVTQNITLDGVIDAADGWFDPRVRRGSTTRTSSMVAPVQPDAPPGCPEAGR